MKKFLAVLAILAFVALPLMAAPTTMTGVVGDSYCAAKHNMKGMSDAQCVRDCVKAGARYVLVVDGKIYSLKGKADDFGKLAAQKVTVTGDIIGAEITVKTIAAAK
jgi:hypothetical protein